MCYPLGMDSYDAWLQHKAECCICERCGKEDHFEKFDPTKDEIICLDCSEDEQAVVDLIEELL